jgi:hypothetical protein
VVGDVPPRNLRRAAIRINQAKVCPARTRVPRDPGPSGRLTEHLFWSIVEGVTGPQRRTRSSARDGRSRISARTTQLPTAPDPYASWSTKPRQRSRWPISPSRRARKNTSTTCCPEPLPRPSPGVPRPCAGCDAARRPRPSAPAAVASTAAPTAVRASSRSIRSRGRRPARSADTPPAPTDPRRLVALRRPDLRAGVVMSGRRGERDSPAR